MKISEELKTKFEENIDIHTMWTHFKTRLESAISKYIPSKTFIQRNDLPWMTTKLKKMCKRKARLHNKAKTSHQWSNYRHFQKECKKSIQTS